ncbi:MAG: IS110 family transposase [Candidatus Accumulibacter meliphilus]|jgi:transposase|uniref:IS110 family transposase n=1 Tax=Candidatus Accumulibacter meliphilus TaxID=2211374 RepID=UPI002FC36632
MELVPIHKRVIGLDIHQAQITACAIIEESSGETRFEQRQFGAFKRDRRALAAWAAALEPEEVVMESTGIYWKSPYAALEAVGLRATVVNARHVKQVPGRKTDVGDAQWLATLARAGLLRGSFVPPAKLRELRLIARQGELTASHVFVLDELLRHIEGLEAAIARFDARLLGELASEMNALALLQTLPGVDLIGAAMLLVEIGSDMSAFGSPDRLASWVGVCPGNNESAGKRKSGRVRKGNLYVRRLLCEFAHAASRTKSAFQSKFQSLIVRRGHKRAIVALAHKMLRTIFFMLKRGEHYRDSATNYEQLSVQRNASRWIKALTRFGFIPAAA